jgi:two-component system response regulator NreC
MENGKTRILLADDHAILRHGLRRIIEAEPDMTVIGEAATGADAVDRIRELQPDVVILDVSMPEQDGIESLKQIANTVSSRVLILSVHLEHSVISDALAAGAAGYLSKDSLDTELVAAVRAVALGGTVFSPSVSRVLAASLQDRSTPPRAQSLDSLTAREREVFVLLAEGKTPTEVARELFVSPKTVHTHRLHIMDKLGLRTTTELIRFALRQGVIKTI